MEGFVNRIAQIVSKVKTDDAVAVLIKAETDLLNEIGLDSLEMIDFLLQLEAAFDISIDFDTIDIEDVRSASTLFQLVERTRSQADP